MPDDHDDTRALTVAFFLAGYLLAFGIFLAAFLMIGGCAVRAGTTPPRFEAVVGYGRITHDCRVDEVPPQLTPFARMTPNEPVEVARCDTLEVGAKSWADTISAIGSAIVAVLML